MTTITMQAPDGINNDTMGLVVCFALALAEKLRAAEIKYGYSNKWMSDDWMDECREKLADHLRKGDPRDVAAYCAFLWHHGEPTYRDTDSHVIAQWERDQKASARIAALEAANAALVAECERLRRKYAFRLNQLLDVREELKVQDHLSEGVWAELCNLENRENHYAKETKE